MNKKTLFGLIAIFAFAFFNFVAVSASPEPGSRKIVVFRENTSDLVKERVIRGHGTPIKKLNLINAEAVFLDRDGIQKLSQDPNVLRVDDDIVVQAVDAQKEGKPGAAVVVPPAQQIPWGINQISAPLAWPTVTGTGIKVAVIDTGIDLTHSDLRTNIKGGINTISLRKSYTDDNGHGTHVAGIIGAVNNTVGVVGVAPKTYLYSVKALDRNGSGYLTDIIEGIDWSVSNKMQVINMSLGAPAGNQSFADAVARAYKAGIVIVAAAGNEGGAVLYPAAYPGVIAVSATDKNNASATWTNHGTEVDLAAPGVDIYSTYKGSLYAIMSGTSMASPHVAGTAALVLSRPVGVYDTDGDSAWDPEEVLQKLKNTATDLGPVGFDEYFGYGLVNAYAAIQ